MSTSYQTLSFMKMPLMRSYAKDGSKKLLPRCIVFFFADHFLVFASNEGIYSLNLDETSNVEMVQVCSRHANFRGADEAEGCTRNLPVEYFLYLSFQKACVSKHFLISDCLMTSFYAVSALSLLITST